MNVLYFSIIVDGNILSFGELTIISSDVANFLWNSDLRCFLMENFVIILPHVQLITSGMGDHNALDLSDLSFKNESLHLKLNDSRSNLNVVIMM